MCNNLSAKMVPKGINQRNRYVTLHAIEAIELRFFEVCKYRFKQGRAFGNRLRPIYVKILQPLQHCGTWCRGRC